MSAESALISISPKASGSDQDADDEEHRDIGNLDLLSQQACDGADGQNEPGGSQSVLGNFDRGGRFQFAILPLANHWCESAREFVMSGFG